MRVRARARPSLPHLVRVGVGVRVRVRVRVRGTVRVKVWIRVREKVRVGAAAHHLCEALPALRPADGPPLARLVAVLRVVLDLAVPRLRHALGEGAGWG